MRALEARLQGRDAQVRSAGPYDRWDLEVRGGALGAARVLMAIEEHGAGRQLARFRIWPHGSPLGTALCAALTTLSLAALLDHAPLTAAALGSAAFLLALLAVQACGTAVATVRSEIRAPDVPMGEHGATWSVEPDAEDVHDADVAPDAHDADVGHVEPDAEDARPIAVHRNGSSNGAADGAGPLPDAGGPGPETALAPTPVARSNGQATGRVAVRTWTSGQEDTRE